MSRKIVEEADIDARLEQIRKHVHDSPVTQPSLGVFGPYSITWKCSGDWIPFWWSAKTLMLQESHPVVGKSLNDHSKVEDDPTGRWKRSFEFVNTMTFSDLETSMSYAKRLWKIHSMFKGVLPDGTPYASNEEDALFWVASSMFLALDESWDMAYGVRTNNEKRRHYQEFKLFAYMFGVSDDTIPPEYEDYKRFYADTVAKPNFLTVDQQTQDRFWKFAHVFQYGSWRELRPLAENYMAFTAGILPPSIRKGFGLPYTLQDRAKYLGTKTLLRTVYPRLPASIRENLYYKQHVRGLYTK